MGSDIIYDHLSSGNTKFGVIGMWVYAIANNMGMTEFTSKKHKKARGGPKAMSATSGRVEEGQPLKETEKGARTSNDAEQVDLLMGQLECPVSTVLEQWGSREGTLSWAVTEHP